MTKRSLLTVVLILALVFMLVACGSDKKESEKTDTGDSEAVTDTDPTDMGDTEAVTDADPTDTDDTEVVPDEDKTDTGTDTEDSSWEAKYKKADESAEKVSKDVVKANNQLGIEIFKRLAKEEGAKNVMISPLSIAISMAMTANGAVDEALAEMKEVLGFGEMDLPDVNEQFAQLIASLVEADKDMVFEIADSVWMDDAFAPGVKEDFISVLEDFYSATLFTEDFADKATVGKINSWVSEQTHEKIDKLIKEIPQNTVMYLINAVYFKAGWTNPFNKDDTHKGSFTLSDGTYKETDYMHAGGFDAPELYFNINSEEGYSVVRLPYGRGVFAFYGLVRSGDIEDFISDIAENGIDSYFEEMRMISRGYELELPKFKFAYEKSLKDTFNALGLEQIFNGGLENISDVEGLRVDEIFHKTFIEIDEGGTEAAAHTYVDPEAGGDPYGFFGTRPFVFVIRDDRTGSILFIGKVEDPTEE